VGESWSTRSDSGGDVESVRRSWDGYVVYIYIYIYIYRGRRWLPQSTQAEHRRCDIERDGRRGRDEPSELDARERERKRERYKADRQPAGRSICTCVFVAWADVRGSVRACVRACCASWLYMDGRIQDTRRRRRDWGRRGMICRPLGGVRADRYTPRKSIVVSLSLWSRVGMEPRCLAGKRERDRMRARAASGGRAWI
jgi:hypothetical protein